MAKKNTNYGAIIKDGLILMAIGLAFALIIKFGFDMLRGDVEENPIITALLQDDFNKIKKSIENETQALNQQDEQGRTPLMWVAYLNYGDRDLINKTSKNKEGKEEPSLADKRFEMAKIFIAKRADLSIKDEDDWTALTWAAWSGLPKIVSLLIENGAVVDVVDKRGQTPLMIAAQRGNDETAKILLAAGANKNLKNKEGLNAFNLATNYMEQFSDRKTHYEAIIKLLAPISSLLKFKPGKILTPRLNFKFASPEQKAKEEAQKAEPAEEQKAKPAEEQKAKPAEEQKAKPAEEQKAKPAEEQKAKPEAIER